MPSIGNIVLGLHTVDRNETVYATAAHNVNHTDTATLSRLERKRGSQDPLRTQLRFERGFVVGDPAAKKEVINKVTIACSVAPGTPEAEVKAYVALCLTQAAAAMSDMAITGDIQLDPGP